MTQTIAKPQTARDSWYDNAKAILILSVVIGHLATGDISPERDWVNSFGKFIYFFHMPVFMMISGRFSRGRVDRKEYGKAVVHLLIPYLILQTGMILLYSAMDIKTSGFSYLSPLFGLWYLFVLFLYSVISPQLCRFRFLFPVSILAAIAAAFLPSPLFGGFQRAVMFYPFFLFGYYTSSCSFAFCKKVWFRCISVLFFAALLLFMMFFGPSLRMDLFTLKTVIADIDGSNHWLIALEYLLHYAGSFVCFFAIMGISPTRKTFFSYVGVYSVYVYALHLFFIVWLRYVTPAIPLPGKGWVLLYLAAGIPLTLLLASKPVRRIFRPFIEPKVNFQRLLETLPLKQK